MIAGVNAPRRTVVSGPDVAVTHHGPRPRARLRGHATGGLASVPLADGGRGRARAGPGLRTAADRAIAAERGIDRDRDSARRRRRLARIAACQVTSPVLFAAAMVQAAAGIDLWIEVGPGQVLSGLVSEIISAPVVSIDAGGPSLIGLLGAVGAAFALGAR